MRRRARPGGGRQVELTIESLGGRGDGVASLDGRPVFLPGVLAGERVLARVTSPKAGGFRGEVVELLEPSPERVEPPCPHFGPCGGCSLQHLNPEAYRRWKEALAPEALAKRGLSAQKLTPLQSVPERSRRRASLAALREGRKVRLGFREQLSHRIVDVESCLILRPKLFELLRPLRSLLADILPDRAQVEIQMLDSETGCDLLLEAAFQPALRQREALAAFAEAQNLARLSWREEDYEPELLALRRQPLVTFGKVPVEPRPGSFLQATAEGEAMLREAIMHFLPEDARRVADLYAGSGAFTFPLAERASVLAVEGDGQSVAALDAAARRSSLSGGVGTLCRDLARYPLRAEELAEFDAVVLDPPRAGAKEQCEALAESALSTVIMLSCHPGSFARDARALADGGFSLVELRPIDQFLWSGHLELAALFRR